MMMNLDDILMTAMAESRTEVPSMSPGRDPLDLSFHFENKVGLKFRCSSQVFKEMLDPAVRTSTVTVPAHR